MMTKWQINGWLLGVWWLTASFSVVGATGPLSIARQIPLALQLQPAVSVDGQQTQQEGVERRISKTITQAGADFIKVHIGSMQLPVGAYLVVRSKNGAEQYRYDGKTSTQATFDHKTGDNGRYSFYAMSVFGDTAELELVLPAGVRWASQHQLSIDHFYAGDEANSMAPDSTCGQNQRKDAVCYADSHPRQFDRSRPVARLLIGGSSLCTAWRVGAANHLLTNNHCVGSSNELSNTEVWFNYQNTQCGQRSLATVVKVTGLQLLKTDYTLDYSLFSVNDFARIQSFGHLGLTVRQPMRGESIFIPQHGAGSPKELAIASDQNNSGLCEIDLAVSNGRATGTDTGYYCDTIGGSSGSPVLAAQSHNAIALHHYGGCPNQGVLISKIWPQIAGHFNDQVPVGDQQDGGGQQPVAEFSSQCTGLRCELSASGSSDPDGTLVHYQWQLAGRTLSTAVSFQHEFALPGRYTLQLTVTDNQGLTATKSRDIVVSDPTVYPLVEGASVLLSGVKEQRLSYRFSTQQPHQRVTISTSGGSGDAQLYTRSTLPPTDSNYDCRPWLSGNNESCQLYLPEPGTVYLQLLGATDFSDVTLTGRSEAVAPSGFPKTNQSAARGSWLRYSYLVPVQSTRLTVKISGGTGDADLYVQKGTPPSQTVYDCRPYQSGNNEQCVLNANAGDVIHIGVYAYRAFGDLLVDVQ